MAEATGEVRNASDSSMKPKLAFVSLWNSADRNVESGYSYSMRNQLQRGFDVIDLFPMALPAEQLLLPVRAAYKLAGRYYHPMREPALLKILASRIAKALRTVKPDVIFAPSSIPLSFVESDCPSFYATDQLFCDFVDTYIHAPSGRFTRLGHEQERRALSGITRATYPSEWAAQSAVTRYGGNREKIDVIPWGANLPQQIVEEDVQASILRRPFNSCDLVFLGRDWKRKGGDLFVKVVEELINLGVSTRATIVGCNPQNLPPNVFEVHPHLDKGQPDHFATLTAIMRRAHFFLLLSRAEAYGQAFCEAAAFGVPSIGSMVGGIPTIIRDGETGFLRPLQTSPQQIAVLIRDALADPARYLRMARQAREDYLQRLNWDSFGTRLIDAVMATV